MNKKEVNPTLFITCRLCLEDLGQYQIVPEVKEQISYCFDIHVEPFDGLPQLICKKCEAILSTYSKIKKKFIEKQNDLKKNISQSCIDSLSQVKEQNSIENLSNKKENKKRKPSISTSSSDTESDKAANGKNSTVETSKSWQEDYTKQYICRVCSSQWITKKSLLCHLKKHYYFIYKYKHVFMKHSIVKLHKVDGKPNITGSEKKVMLGKEKIIVNKDPRYYIIYKHKNPNIAYCDTLKTRNVYAKKIDKTKDEASSDSSQDNIVFKRKRTRRLCSRSSNETVVLDTPIKSDLSNKESRNSDKLSTPTDLDDCINIDDSSEDETPLLRDLLKNKKGEKLINEENIQNNIAVKPDQVTIHNVITACRSKYVKKHYQENLMLKDKPSNVALQLKRKILSLGRKIIHKKLNVNCTPLLRFMDHKNLDITWLPREIKINQDANFIRIMTRIRSSDENCDNETGWTDYMPTQVFRSKTASTPRDDNSVEFSNNGPNNVPNEINIPEVPSGSHSIESTLPENSVLISDASLLAVDTKKLLNSNPVANPKQLPKKTIVKSVVISTEGGISLENTDNDFCMPIITSTTSLAVPFLVESNSTSETASSKNDNLKSDAPRIKVKPVSELMSAETLSRLQEPVHMPCKVSAGTTGPPMTVQTENNTINLYTSQTDLYQVTSGQGDFALNLIAPEPAWQNEFMMLDTVEMPNTTTNSPFLYFRRLLRMHGIVLLDTSAELSKDFNCLIRFKVLYKQDKQNQPVILCLALFCSKNVFCLKVRDRNQENLDLTKISPNWQWEVLKIYKGEVVNKLLFNAQKIGPDVYENTTNFLCLLKSINLVKTS